MDTARDSALHMQVLDGCIFYIAEKRTRLTVIAPNVSGSYRMTIAVESTTIGSIFVKSYTFVRGEVGLQTGINLRFTRGLIHSITKLYPVILVTDDILLSRSLFNA